MAREWQRVVVMNKNDTEQILDYLKLIDESINGPRPRADSPGDKRPLSDRMDAVEKKVDKLDNRVSEVQLGLATLGVSTTEQFQKVDENFRKVDENFRKIDLQFRKTNGKIDDSTAMLKDLVERVHAELTGRIVDLELPGPGGRKGGGSGSGGGVPLAS